LGLGLHSAWTSIYSWADGNLSSLGTVENHGKKMAKTRQTVKVAKIVAKSQHQITCPKTIVMSMKLNVLH